MMDQAVDDLKRHYVEFEKDFTDYFEDLQKYSNNKLNQLLTG